MKTFIAAIIIFSLLCGAVFGISACVLQRFSELSALADALPQKEEEFAPPDEDLLKSVSELYRLWDKTMRFLPYIVDYDMLERADEAALSLFAYANAGEYAEFLASKARFSDAIARLRVLFGVNFSAVA